MTTPKLPGSVAEEDQRAAIFDALFERRRTGRMHDGRRIALVVSGGGMRGAYTGGMAHALEDAGLGQCFDIVYGSSAGAFVGAALLLGNGRGSAAIFHEDMASRAFIDARRLGSRRPMVSLDHLLDGIMATTKPMPWPELAELGERLRVVATDAKTLQPHVLEPHTIAEWRLAMRATAAIPFLTGSAVVLAGRSWIDGSVSDPIPLRFALADHPTDVLVLVNRTWPELVAMPLRNRPALWARSLDLLRPGAGLMLQENLRRAPTVAILTDPAHPARRGINLATLAPAGDAGVRGLTTDPSRVRHAAQLGYEAMTEALGGSTAA